MRICLAYLVVVDISGYTRFITERSLALEHAEQIVTDLLDSVLDQSRHPLILNKLEGDAALMYAEIDPVDAEAGRDMLAQVRSFFPAFRQRVAALSALRRNCNCDACSNITALGLKAFVHTGEILLKKVRQLDELAGEPVILLHRLMKNSVPTKEYVLLTDATAEHAGLDRSSLAGHDEDVEGMGRHRVWVVDASALPETKAAGDGGHGRSEQAPRTDTPRKLPQEDETVGLFGRISGWWKSRRN
jgi:hypothetical protein